MPPTLSSAHLATRAPKHRVALWITLCGIFVSNITLTILTIALPYIARDLSADRALTNWVSLGPMLVVALCTPAAGRAADTFGRKRVWLCGFGLALLGMAGSAVAPSIGPLIVSRLVTGVGSGLLVPAALAIATDLYPPEQRATPVGYWTSAVAISPLVGVLIGGALLDVVSWRWLFVAQIVCGLPPFIAAWIGFDDQRFPTVGRFDWEGSAAIGLAALSLMLGATWLGTYATHAWRIAVALACAAGAGVWAYAAEQRAENPVFPPYLLRDPAVGLSLISRVSLNFGYMGAFMTLPYLLSELWGWSALAISGMLVWRPLAMGLTGPLAGMLTQRLGPARLVAWGGWCILLATAAFIGLDAAPRPPLLITALVLAGVGLGLAATASVAVVTERVDSELLGSVSSLMTLSATLANALGMAVMFATVEASGGVRHAPAYRASFWVGSAVVAAGVAAGHKLRALERRQAGGRLPPP